MVFFSYNIRPWLELTLELQELMWYIDFSGKRIGKTTLNWIREIKGETLKSRNLVCIFTGNLCYITLHWYILEYVSVSWWLINDDTVNFFNVFSFLYIIFHSFIFFEFTLLFFHDVLPTILGLKELDSYGILSKY